MQLILNTLLDKIPFLRGRLDDHMLEVVREASIAFVLKLLSAGLSFGFNVLLARLLGAKGAGIYYLALTVTTIASVMGRIGLDNTLLRFTAANADQGDWSKVAGVCRKGIRIAVATLILATLVIFISAPFIAKVIFDDSALLTPLRLMALSIVPLGLLTLYSEMLKGLKKIREAILVQGLGVPAVSILLLIFWGGTLKVTGAVIAYVVATILVLLLGIFLWRHSTPALRNLRAGFHTRLLIDTSLPLFWAATMNLVMSWTATILLGFWSDSQSVGIYAIAMRTAMLTGFILLAVNSSIAPKFAALYARGEFHVLGRLARNAAQLSTLLAMPLLLAFILTPQWVIGLFGPDFSLGAPVLAILAIGQFVNVGSGSVGYLLIMSGHEKLVRNNSSFSAALNLVLNALLIPRYGIIGAAIASSASLAIMNMVSVRLVYSKLSIMTLPIPRKMLVYKK